MSICVCIYVGDKYRKLSRGWLKLKASLDMPLVCVYVFIYTCYMHICNDN